MKEEKNPLDNTDDYKKIENVITQSENKKDIRSKICKIL